MIKNNETKYNVLIFEDDLSLALDWKEALTKKGINVEHAWDIDNAINLCNQKKFDVIICDIFIKDSNGNFKDEAGITLLVSLRSQLRDAPLWGRQVPVLAVTGSPVNFGFNVLDNVKSMGTSLTMRKPFTASKLAERVQEIILEVASKKNDHE